jgi:HK97 family phage portal protein
MSVVSKVLGWFEKRSGSLGELERFLISTNTTAAGIAVGPETALQYPPVFAAVWLIAESIGQLPVHLYQKNGEDRKRADSHSVEKLIAKRPADWITPLEFKVSMTVSLLLHGESFALINRSGDGRPLEIVPVPNSCLTCKIAPGAEPEYTIALADGSQQAIDRDRIFHLRGLSAAGGKPISPVHCGREAIALGLQLERHAANLMRRGARPAGTLEVPGKLSDPAVARLRASIQNLHSNSESGSTMVLEEGSKYSPLTFSSVDLQFQEMRTFQVAEVSRLFRVPLSLLSEMSRVTHANAESLGRQFLSLTLLPYLRLWCETLARDLLTQEEQDEYYFEFNANALEMADLANRVDAYVKSISGGLLTPDEARARENLPPVGGEAAKLRFPLNTANGAGSANG